MPPAAPIVFWVHITVIQCNVCRLYDFLVVQSSYANATCRWPPLWCAGCIILSYSPMPAACMISWLYCDLMQMPHAAGCPNGVPAVYYCHTVQCLPLISFAGCIVILCQCHMPLAAPMVRRLHNTVIQSTACHLYDFLVVQ